MKALRDCKWTCDGKKYILSNGKDVKINKEHEEKAIASGLFENNKTKQEEKKEDKE